MRRTRSGLASLVCAALSVSAFAQDEASARTAEVRSEETREDTFAPDPQVVIREDLLREAPPIPLGIEVSPDEVRPPSLPKLLWLDLTHVLSSPFRWDGHDFLLLGASIAAVGIAAPFDQRVSDEARGDTPTLGRTGETLEGLGDIRSVILMGGFVAVGALTGDRKAKDVGVDGLLAGAIGSGVVNAAIATLVGRERPTTGEGAYSFHAFGARSFPSGHVAQSFSVCSVIAASYDQWYVKVAAYGSGVVSAWARLRRGKHYLSDVIGGAIVGTAVGHTVVKYNRRLRYGEGVEPEERRARLSVTPILDRRTFGFNASLSF